MPAQLKAATNPGRQAFWSVTQAELWQAGAGGLDALPLSMTWLYGARRSWPAAPALV